MRSPDPDSEADSAAANIPHPPTNAQMYEGTMEGGKRTCSHYQLVSLVEARRPAESAAPPRRALLAFAVS